MEIILKAVSKKIGYTQVLDNINCLFLGGKIYGIVGYNGSGKTMLLRTIAGLVIPTSGTIDFDGKRLHRDISIQALMENPDILILDEPFNALDEKSVLLLRKLLCQRRDEGKLIIVTSHHKDDIEAICDEVIVMQDGTLKKPNDEGKQ